MAGFQTHITVSTAVGVGYGWWIHTQFGLPWTTATVAGGLCSVAGMLPDLDSDSGVPARETIGFTAAIVPLLLMPRLQQSGMTIEQMILIGAPIYLLIRFGIGSVLKHFTVHRGMFHSIPALAIAGMTTFLISDSGSVTVRALKGVAVALGFLSHLVLDEIYSVEVTMTGSRLKSSSGTALKFFGNNAAANAVCWGLMLFTVFGVLRDPGVQGRQTRLVAPTLEMDRVPIVEAPPAAPPYDAFDPLPALPPRLTPRRPGTRGPERLAPRGRTTADRDDPFTTFDR
jgi:hypothetical protein